MDSPAQPAHLIIDVSSNTGPVLHGASGWLYGQSAPEIPTVNMMEPLHPQISAQKPNGGMQHPMADASLVAPDFLAAGGKLMQIYMQDIYPDWTYNDLGIDDYLQKVDAMTRQISADPHHSLFVYVPFNEPNNNWYADNGPKFTKFLHDWMLVYRRIRSIDPGARIAGPGFEHFNGAAFESFLLFARDNHVLPDEFTWHELHDDFFPEWYRRVATYRAAEVRLGIGPLPIVINEYGRDKGDLAVPGNLVQWIARLENSKVYGCLAFWTPSGTLADLTARIWPNRPTGAWWLYQWYGSMTGNTVRVTSPSADAVGLQGVASVDASRQQVRMIFGGTAQAIELTMRGLENMNGFQQGVHVSIWRIASSGNEPSPNPMRIEDENQALSGHLLTISVPAASADAAYSLILTPAHSTGSIVANPRSSPEILAVDSDFDGNAVYDPSRNSAVRLVPRTTGSKPSVRFIDSVPRDGYYSARLAYRAADRAHLQLDVDDEPTRTLILSSKPGQDRTEQDFRLFLAAGVHRLRFSIADSSPPVSIKSLKLVETREPLELYQTPAQSAAVTAGSVEFKGVQAKTAGRYTVIVTYANDEAGHKGQIDQQIVVTVNGVLTSKIWLRDTFDASVFATTVVKLSLQAGENKIRFAGASGSTPLIQSIQLATLREK